MATTSTARYDWCINEVAWTKICSSGSSWLQSARCAQKCCAGLQVNYHIILLYYLILFFSFGTRHRQFSSDCSPGPAHFVRPNITRKGRDGTPQYSLYGRHRAIKVIFTAFSVPLLQFIFQNLQTPGPGSYVPEKVTNVFSSAPSYSLAARTSGQMTQTSPGPAAYVLSAAIGSNVKTKASAPAYSMSSRKSFGSFSEGNSKFISIQIVSSFFRFKKDTRTWNI